MKSVQSLTPQVAPAVTIALPVFNAASTLPLAVESILTQSFSDWELLILDDGSTDSGIEQLRCLADSRIKVIRDGCNKGLAHRLNQAIDLAQGKYFARMDHDDISHPERLGLQVKYLDEHPEVDLISARCLTMDESERLNGMLPIADRHENICHRPWMGFYMPHPTWMGRTTWFREHKYREPGPYFCEDQELLLRASSESVYFSLPYTLLAYRVRRITPWRKQWRTRFALAKVQSEFFWCRGRYGSLLLSWLVTGLRLISDIWRRWFVHLAAVRTTVAPPDEVITWEGIIANLKNKVR